MKPILYHDKEIRFFYLVLFTITQSSNLEILMKIFRNLSFIFAVFSILSGSVNAHEMVAEELEKTNQRYQIFIAEHNAILNSKSITMKSIFKIDLDTGTVWRYRQGVDSKGKPYEEFFEVPNQ